MRLQRRRLQHLRAQVNVFGPDVRRTDRRSRSCRCSTLFHQLIDLVSHHRRLIHKQRARGMAGQARAAISALRRQRRQKNSQPGKTLTPPAVAASAAISSSSSPCLALPRRAAGSAARAPQPADAPVTGVSVSGSSSVSSRPLLPRTRCVSGSNLRMVSISSPKNSMRMGRSRTQASRRRGIPPRRVNWPGISTKVHLRVAHALARWRGENLKIRASSPRRNCVTAKYGIVIAIEQLKRRRFNRSNKNVDRVWSRTSTMPRHAAPARPGCGERFSNGKHVVSRQVSTTRAGSICAGQLEQPALSRVPAPRRPCCRPR